MQTIKKIAVIGAGTMGSGIASHATNAGYPVVLLDIVPKQGDDRDAISKFAVQRLLTASPPAFMDKRNADLITTGNIEDHLDLLADVDWIAEAIVERLDVKQALYEKIDTVRKPEAMISSNTSTIPLSLLTENMSAGMKENFCITHFFNPVRYMRLLELVSGPHTRSEVIDNLSKFCDEDLGKGVVRCNDTPGFLGNRVGVYALQVAIIAAAELGLKIEEADALMGRPMGIPKTGVFGLYDLIGLDLMLDVASSLAGVLPVTDAFHKVAAGIPLIGELVEKGHCGNKSGGGFFRTITQNGESVREAINLQTGQYRRATRPILETAVRGEADGLRALVEADDKYGRFAWRVLSHTLSYAASLVPHTSEDLLPIDEAMKLGYGWLKGPFEMIDELNVGWFCQKLADDGLPVPEILTTAADTSLYRVKDGRVQTIAADGKYKDLARPPGMLRLNDITRASRPLANNAAASFWDLGNGVGCIEFHSKANALSPVTMELVEEAVMISRERFRGLLIYNDAPHFSVGFNLDYALSSAKRGEFDQLDRALLAFQKTCMALKYAPIPVVSAPSGMALGGGYEILVHSDALQAHANSVMGLVETIVGLVPSGGGCKELLHRWTQAAENDGERLDGAMKVFEFIGMGKTGTAPLQWLRMKLALERDRTSMNRDRLLLDGKALVLELINAYHPPTQPNFKALGNRGRDNMRDMLHSLKEKGIATPHDLVVGNHLMEVLCGGDLTEGKALSEDELCALERQAFIALAKTNETTDRIAHMLEFGKPLRN